MAANKGRIAYIDGRFMPMAAARVSIEDRGFQFADAIYEVWGVHAGVLLDQAGHFARLWRSLDALEIPRPMSEPALRAVLEETRRRNRVRDGNVYLQVSRGAAPRDHVFPEPGTRPTVVVAAKPAAPGLAARLAAGIAVITRPDQRWRRCDIKTVGLTANVLAKEAARRAGASEAWLVDADGLVTEGAATSAWIVTAARVLVTRDLLANILPGVTRVNTASLAEELGFTVEERAFSPQEAASSAEAFATAASSLVLPVVRIDGHIIGDGRPGPISRALFAAYRTRAAAESAVQHGHGTARRLAL